jgi:hypothetical protein
MIVDFDGGQRLSLKKTIKNKAANKHVDVIDLKEVLSDLRSPRSVFFIKNIKMNPGLINAFHMLPCAHESKRLVSLPITRTIESFMKIVDVGLNGRRMLAEGDGKWRQNKQKEKDQECVVHDE